MIVNNYSSKLSSYCKELFGMSLYDFFSSRDVICVHIHFLNGFPLYYVTPFYSDDLFNACKSSGVVPYYVSSNSFSELVRYFSLKFPAKHFNFLCYEK